MAKVSKKKTAKKVKKIPNRVVLSDADIKATDMAAIPNRLVIRKRIDALAVGKGIEMPIVHWNALRNAASNAKKSYQYLRDFTVHKINETTVGLWRTA